ncbi:MAG: amidohydrolase [Rhodobacteraceae bacterium]|nr:amidohydrolase [Paracoccaceae bacterium]
MSFLRKVFFVAVLAAPAQVAIGDETHPIGDAINDVPLFDAHIHYKEPAWGPFPPPTIIQMMDRNGVAMGLVSSTPDTGTIKLWEYAPNRIVPELRPYKKGAGSSDWTKAPDMEAYLQKRLAAYPHQGLGEFHVHRLDPDDEPLLRKVAKMAIERNIPIHIHSGAKPVEQFFRYEPKLTIIWAHAGMSEPASVVMRTMNRHNNLYADTSYREYDILSPKGIEPEWRKVIVKHQDRLMIGSDTWINDQWYDYGDLIDINRRWLSHFPREIAEKIAYRNAERLFGRKVSNDLLGTR